MKASIFRLCLWSLVFISLSACGTPVPASSTPSGIGARQTIQIVSEITARHRRVAYLREDFPLTRRFTSGTAWAIEMNGRRLLVSAAHVVGVGERPQPVHFEEMQNGEIVARNPLNLSDLKERDISYRVRIGLGELGLGVATIGTTPDLPDGVFLEPTDTRIWRELRPTALATKNLLRLEEVTVLGYPSTFSEQPTNALVAEIYPGYFVLNRELDPGYSGGLVTNRSGEAVGVVASVTKKQTTVFFITQRTLSSASFRPASELLVKNAEKLPP